MRTAPFPADCPPIAEEAATSAGAVPSVDDAPDIVRSRLRFGVKPGLDRIRRLLHRLDRPDRSYPIVHVAGTNGKGSTAAMIAAGLAAAGYRVGMYSSPHLVSYRERMLVDGRPVSPEELADAVAELEPVLAAVEGEDDCGDGRLTEFEVGTALAFTVFRRCQVDVAVVEVGLGGRWDATNAVDPVLTVITPVSLDHTAVLGETLAQVAAEKAGIMKPGVPLVVAPQHPEVAPVIAERASELQVPVVAVGPGAVTPAVVQLAAYPLSCDTGGVWVRVEPAGTGGRQDGRWIGAAVSFLEAMSDQPLRAALPGRHQAVNAAVATAALAVLAGKGWQVTPGAVRRGLRGVRWPGRAEIVERSPLILLDGAHNDESAAALAALLAELSLPRPAVLVFGALVEKPAERMLALWATYFDHLVVTRADGRTPARDPAELAAVASAVWKGTLQIGGPPADALDLARSLAGRDGSVVVAGSLYLVGALRGRWPWPPCFSRASAEVGVVF